MGYYLTDMIHDYLYYNNTYDIYRMCQRGIAEAIVRDKTIDRLGKDKLEEIMEHDDNGYDYLYNLEEEEVEEYTKRIDEFIKGLRNEHN